MSNVCPWQTDWHFTNHTWTQLHTWKMFRSRKCHADRFVIRTPTEWKVGKHPYYNWFFCHNTLLFTSYPIRQLLTLQNSLFLSWWDMFINQQKRQLTQVQTLFQIWYMKQMECQILKSTMQQQYMHKPLVS